MTRNSELARLKELKQEAFRKKQETYRKFIDLSSQTNDAYDEMQQLWGVCCSTHEEMQSEYDSMKACSENYQAIWSQYSSVRELNNSRIQQLRYDADSEHQSMISAFEQASYEYQYGDKSMASVYSEQGRSHRNRRDELNHEVQYLIQEIRAAKEYAELHASKTDSSAFRRAKELYMQAKKEHQEALLRFKKLKEERKRFKADFDAAQSVFLERREDYNNCLKGYKVQEKIRREGILDKAGIGILERDNAKIVEKPDGTVQIYHGGIGEGDGIGHGHTVIDSFGKKTYAREAFEEHGRHNYTDPALKTYPSRGQWTELRHGWIDDHPVTWCEGTGVNSGQTLICDGHVDREYFDSHHDHYGMDTKYGTGRRIEDITDSMGRKKYYSGPGK